MPYDKEPPGGIRGEGRAVEKTGDLKPGVIPGKSHQENTLTNFLLTDRVFCKTFVPCALP
jgi:hypothetical protein